MRPRTVQQDAPTPPRPRRDTTPAPPHLLDLVDLVYRGATDATCWHAFLVQLVERLGATSGALSVRDGTPPNSFDKRVSSVGPEPADLTTATRYQWAPVRRTPHIETGWRVEDRSPHLDRVPQGRQRRQPHDGVPYLRMVLRERREHTVTLVVYRATERPAFARRALALCEALAPHLARAFALQRRVHRAESALQATTDALDHAALGVVLLDGRGSVVRVNESARRTLDVGDGLTLRDGRLTATASAEAALRALVARVCLAARGDGRSSPEGHQQSWQVLQLARPSTRTPLSIAATPLRGRGPSADASTPVALAFVSDPDAKTAPPVSLLRQLYDLTPAEARVAARMLHDASVADTARDLGITSNTIRTHLKRIFDKVGVTRRSSLVGLLLRGPAQLNHEPSRHHTREHDLARSAR